LDNKVFGITDARCDREVQTRNMYKYVSSASSNAHEMRIL